VICGLRIDADGGEAIDWQRIGQIYNLYDGPGAGRGKNAGAADGTVSDPMQV
jgi:hypothetical protein